MKRRTFIQATLLAAPAAHAAVGDRLHGVPGSVSPQLLEGAPRLSLHLSRSGVPPQFWAQLDAVGQTVLDAMRSPDQGGALAADPAKFLQRHGVDASDITLQDESVRLAVTLADPAVQHAIAARDYAALLMRLEFAGVLRRVQPSRLQHQLESVLVRNTAEIRALLRERAASLPHSEQASFLALLGDDSRTATVDDLAAIREVLVLGMGTTRRAAVVIATIAILISVVVSVAVALAVAVQVHVISAARALGGAARLDPDLIANHARVQRISALVGDSGLGVQALRDLTRAESTALVDAMHATGLVRIRAQDRDTIIEALTSYSLKVALP
jgi:hypothetical protein